MLYNHKFITIFKLLALIFNVLFNFVLGQNKPFPQVVAYPNTIKPNNVSQQSMDNSVTTFYDYWKSSYLKPSNGNTPGGYFVYVSVAPGKKTVSEAHGYGMIITALLAGYDSAAKIYFDGMYFMYKKHPSIIDPDLLSWVISSDEDPDKNEDSATDGDMDIAYALLLANDQWGSEGIINYLAEAKRIINNGIEESESNNYRLMLGDWWDIDSQWATRSSDWMPDHLRAYYHVTGNEYWIALTDTIYGLINSLTNNYSPNYGLIPDFVNGQIPAPVQPNFLESEYDGAYNWNACRFPLRIAVDYAHYSTTTAKYSLNKILNWLKNKSNNDPIEIKPGYFLTGEPIPNREYSSLAFTAPIIAACIIDKSHQQYLNTGWSIISNSKEESYFGDTINLLSLLLISGNWWKPDEDNLNSIKVSNTNTSPIEPSLKQNYPNPFNPSTVISWQLPVSSHTTITVYNILGKEVATLINKYQQAGSYKIIFEGSSLGSGIYYYQLKARTSKYTSSFIDTKKLSFIK